VKAAPFEYHRPATATEAVETLVELGDTAKVLGGGQSLAPMLALRLATFEHLVDVSRIDELRGIERVDGGVRIGPSTTQATIERSSELAATVPLLARATPLIGHFQIRNRGTLGGSLAHADPAAEYPAVALALDAELEIRSPGGVRSVPAADFFTGLWSTVVGDDELLVGVTFPERSARSGFAIREFARRHGDFAIAGAAIAIELDGDQRVARCGIGLLGLGSAPERARVAERTVLASSITEIDAHEVGQLATDGLESVPSDVHGSAAYRRRVGAAMVVDAWQAAAEEARRG